MPGVPVLMRGAGISSHPGRTMSLAWEPEPPVPCPRLFQQRGGALIDASFYSAEQGFCASSACPQAGAKAAVGRAAAVEDRAPPRRFGAASARAHHGIAAATVERRVADDAVPLAHR